MATRVPGHDQGRGLRRVLAIGGAGLAWGCAVLVIGALAVAVVVPRLTGATPYTILTSSMRPHLPPGTLVVVRPVDATTVGVGDVITYQLRSGRAAVVTHRVVEVGRTPDGSPWFRTQGDANDVADQALVRPVQIRGRLWYAVPRLGRFSHLLSDQQRTAGITLLAGGLFCYAAVMWFGWARDRRRDHS